MIKSSSFLHEQVNLHNYRSRTSSHYLEKIEPYILESFTSEQLEAITDVLNQAIPKPSPKIVDFRFVVDVVFSRFYIVLFVGKDLRRNKRQYVAEGIARVGNLIAATTLLIGTNLAISSFILLCAYLIKSAVGIDFFSGHISETLQKL